MNKEEAMVDFKVKLIEKLARETDLKWECEKKGSVNGWCTLAAPEEIELVAEVVASFNGRLMTISPLNTPAAFAVAGSSEAFGQEVESAANLVINYHFFFAGVNFTVCMTMPGNQRRVKSITPLLKSADWHEREIQELFNIQLEGHPNSKRLFLDEGIHLTDQTMIPLSEAMSGASTSTLWEKIMHSDRKEECADE